MLCVALAITKGTAADRVRQASPVTSASLSQIRLKDESSDPAEHSDKHNDCKQHQEKIAQHVIRECEYNGIGAKQEAEDDSPAARDPS